MVKYCTWDVASSWADPGSFLRGGPTLTTFLFCFVFLVDERIQIPL